MKWEEIPQRMRRGSYEVNCGLNYMEKFIKGLIEEDELILNPDFQRGHVWTKQQQINYLEYFLSGGESGKVLYFNKPSWNTTASTTYDDFVCVDGLQRITALLDFLGNKIKAYGQYRKDFGKKLRMSSQCNSLRINVNDLQTKKAVLKWYIQINSGGTPHTKEEINKVKNLLTNTL